MLLGNQKMSIYVGKGSVRLGGRIGTVPDKQEFHPGRLAVLEYRVQDSDHLGLQVAGN